MAETTTNKSVDNPELFNQIINDYREDRRTLFARDLPKMWERYEDHYRNDYWKDIDRDEHLSSMSSNGLFEVVESQLPVITARAPKPDVVLEPIALEESQMEEANRYKGQVQRELIKIWSDDDGNDMQEVIQKGFREHNIKGKSLYHSEYDFKDYKIITEVADIYSLTPDRHKDSIEACQKSHLTYATYRTPAWLKQKYGIDVEAEGYFNDDGEFEYHSNQSIMRTAASFAINAIKGFISTEDGDKKRGYCLMLKYYCSGVVLIDDESTEKYNDNKYNDDGTKMIGDDGKEIMEESTRDKYPFGRVIVVVRNYKDKIISDKKNIYPRFPFFETTNYGRAGDFYGTSEGLNIEDHTAATNLLMSNVTDNLRFTGNPQRFEVEGGNGEDMPVIPGSTVKTVIPGGVGYLEPPRMSPMIMVFLEWLQRDQDRKTGNSDSMRGMAESADSGIKVQTQISQGTGRLQPKSSQFLTLARKLFNYWIYIIQNFYPDVVMQEITDDEGQTVFEEFRPRDGAHLKMRVRIGNTAMLPADNFGAFEEAKYLFELGMSTFGFPFVSPKHLVDLAPALGDQAKIKAWIDEQFKAKEDAAFMDQMMGGEEGAGAGLKPLPEEREALQNAAEAGDQEAIVAILDGMKARMMAEKNQPVEEARA
jgi:hypothetical protein